jgi:hypothetical protein
VLYDSGVFPARGTAILGGGPTRGQPTVEELVDRFELRNTDVRDLLVDYLNRRSVDLDYSTLDNLVRNLVGHFWKVIEETNPEQPDLRLDEGTVRRWKERVAVRRDGKKRSWLTASTLPFERSISTCTRGQRPSPSAGPAGSRRAPSAIPTCGSSTFDGDNCPNAWPTGPANANLYCRYCRSTPTTTGISCAPGADERPGKALIKNPGAREGAPQQRR